MVATLRWQLSPNFEPHTYVVLITAQKGKLVLVIVSIQVVDFYSVVQARLRLAMMEVVLVA